MEKNQQSSLLETGEGGACRLEEMNLRSLEYIEFSNHSNTS